MGLNLILRESVLSGKKIDTINFQQYVDLYLQTTVLDLSPSEILAVENLADTLISQNLFGKLDCIYPILGNTERTVGLNLRSSKYALDFSPPKSTGGTIQFSQKGIYVDTEDVTGTSCAPINTQFRTNSTNQCIIVHLGTKVKDYYNPKVVSYSYHNVGKENQNTINSIIYTNTGLNPPQVGYGIQVGIMQDVNDIFSELIEVQDIQDPASTIFVNRYQNELTLRLDGDLVNSKIITQSFDARNCYSSFVLGHVSKSGTYGLFNNPIKFLIIGYGLTATECTTLQNAVTTFLTAVGK